MPQPLEYKFHRRRYGRSDWYCWAWVKAPDGTWLDLWDPSPTRSWDKISLDLLGRARLALHAGEGATFRELRLQAWEREEVLVGAPTVFSTWAAETRAQDRAEGKAAT